MDGTPQAATPSAAPTTSVGNAPGPDRASTSEIAELVERLHSRIDHSDDRITSAGVRVLSSVGPFLLLVFAVAKFLQPSSAELRDVDDRLLVAAAVAGVVAFLLGLASLVPRKVAFVSGHHLEDAVDGTVAKSLNELVAQEANEAGSRQFSLNRRGWLVLLAMATYALSIAMSCAYLFVVLNSR